MYWAHLTFTLVLGFSITNWTGGIKPGYLDFDNLPETNFSCEGKVIGGYYADVETGCQMFHVCTIGQKAEVTDIKFLCLNGTVFDQETRVCERIDEVDCSKSEDFFNLNLELYGNHAGIQPENEFECEDCITDDYDLETTTLATTTTTSRPTTTTIKTTTAQPVKVDYPSSSPETFAALLALHNAFTQTLQSRVKPPPPRVINHAFASTTQKPPYYRPTGHYYLDSQGYEQRLTTLRSNYHHFHSGDASFSHSLDSNKPYNYQYFRPKPKVSIVTSTSTSTSVKTSKNSTYPIYDYQDEEIDDFFDDVPKLRSKRSERFSNHKYPQEEQHPNHRYEEKPKEEFLQNLLGSIDMEERDRQKMVNFFIKEEKDMNNSMVNKLGNKMSDIILADVNKTIENAKNESVFDLDELSRLWNDHYEEMNKEVNLDFSLPENRVKRQTNIDTERFGTGRRKNRTNTRNSNRNPKVVPVVEEIEGDLTTTPFKRVTGRATTASRRVNRIRFNYETTEVTPEATIATVSTTASKIRTVPVYEDRPSHQDEKIAQIVPNSKRPSRGRVRGTLREPTTTQRPSTTMDPALKPDPNFDCQGKVKGGFYADVYTNCRGFFICSQGQINGPLLKSHFWCGAETKFNQRSRTCQAADLVECSISERYFHLNNDFLVPETESDLKGNFEPMKTGR